MLTHEQESRIRMLVDDLRTTKIQQGQEMLRQITQDGIVKDCCLGRACDLYRVYEDGKWVFGHDNGAIFTAIKFDEAGQMMETSSSTSLPEFVRDWFGFEDGNPNIHTVGEETTAAFCNDSREFSFPQIADMFEWYYLSDTRWIIGNDPLTGDPIDYTNHERSYSDIVRDGMVE